MFITGRIFPKNAIEYRDLQIQYRDKIIDKKDETIQKQQDLFDQALRTMREDLIPLIERGYSGEKKWA